MTLISVDHKKLELIKIISIFLLIMSIKSEPTNCTRDTPILTGGQCKLEYCSKERFNSSDCRIANSIVKTQWLNNIIVFGDKNYRYVNFGMFSNGDMVLSTTTYPKSMIRYFYGLKQNGRPYFSDESTSYANLTSGSDDGLFESEGSITTIFGDNNKEYLIVIGKLENLVEIYDFENSKVYYQSVQSEFSSINSVKSLRHCYIPIQSTSSKYYLFGYIGTQEANSDDVKVYFQKHTKYTENTSLGISTFTVTKEEPKQKENGYGRQVSCFFSTSEYILCFYLLTKGSKTMKFNFIKYNKDLGREKHKDYESNLEDGDIFCKCIHLKEEFGVFSSYYNKSDIVYPFLLIRGYSDREFVNYLSSDFESSMIILKRQNLLTNLLLNDIVKMNDNKVAFAGVASSKEILYIITLNLFGDKQYKIRYYDIQIFALYHYKIFSELRLSLYNNFLSFAASFCPSETCAKDEVDDHYSSLIIFSYPSSTDIIFSLDNHLFNNNHISIESVELNLANNLNLENNIFGYVLSNIIVFDPDENSGYNLYSSKYESKIIEAESVLEKDENIILKYVDDLANVALLEKKIKYYFAASEPDFSVYDAYPQETEGDNDKSYFQNGKYIGRLNYYTIKLDNILTNKDCTDINCKFCRKLQKDFCVTCKYNYTIYDGIKTCFNPESIDSTIGQIVTTEPITELTTQVITELTTELITEKMTELTTELITEKMAELTPELITEKMTELTTELVTQKLTELVTEKITELTTELIKEKSTDIIIDTTSQIKNIETTEMIEITDLITEKISENGCSKDDIIKNKCNQGSVTDDQIGLIYNQLKDNYLTKDYEGENTIIQTENVVFQISTIKDQQDSGNVNASSIDLGDCEQELISHYKIPKNVSLIMFKTDIKTEDLSQTFVQYEIYDPRNMTLLDLSVCKDMKISISTPVKLDASTSSLYDSLKDSGYDLFNEEDSFYTDICSTFTSENGTDMTLADRKKEIYSTMGNISLCQSGCELESYNSTTKKAKCECNPQTQESELAVSSSSDKFNVKKVADSFFSTLSNSNFLVLKCYKLAINLKNFFINIGRILMTVILLLSLIFLIIFFANDNKKIDKYIASIMKARLNYINKNKKKNKMNIKNKNKNKQTTNKKGNKNLSKNKMPKIKKKKKELKAPPKKLSVPNINKKNSKNLKYSISSRKHLINKSTNGNTTNISIVKINAINIGNSEVKKKMINNNKKNKLILKNNDNKNSKHYYQTSKDLLNIKEISKTEYSKDIKDMKNDIRFKNMNDQELNTLEYEIAVVIDKRTYFQYYWSLLKKKQLLIFTFYPTEDYNLFTIKICLFLFSFSLYLTINGFFFSDDTMHKIHEDNGAFDLILQIPQILYSTIISAAINIILKMLSLSENNIIALKQANEYKKMKILREKIKKCLTIKFIIFYFLNFTFLLFFWYFVSCFCAVYKNTQIILIKDTIISFSLSMVYPFGLNLLPGLFRIPAIKAKNQKGIYKFSQLVALI